MHESIHIKPYKVTYLKDAYPALISIENHQYPAIRLPYSSNLLDEYCNMIQPEINNRDVIIFAIH